MNLNLQITILVFIAFLISLLILYVITNLSGSIPQTGSSIFHKKFYSNIADEKHKIFLIGSSQVAIANPDYIEQLLMENGKEYHVYNMGQGDDHPSLRLNDIDSIISSNPEVVVYGIGLWDFGPFQKIEDSLSTSSSDKPKSIMPDPQAISKLITLPPLLSQFWYLFPSNPLLMTLQIMHSTTEKSVHYKNPNSHHFVINLGEDQIPHYYVLNNTQIFSTTKKELISTEENKRPFYSVVGRSTIENDASLLTQSQNNPFHGFDPNMIKNNVDSLEEIIYKLQKAHIRVIVFTVPYSKFYLETVPTSDMQFFNYKIDNIGKKFGIKTYNLTDRYGCLHIWYDFIHVSYNKTAAIYNQDLTKMILNEDLTPFSCGN